MKISYFVSPLVCLICGGSLLPAQAVFQPGGGGGQQPAPASASMQAPSTPFDSQAFINVADRVFNPDSDALNLEEGTFLWKGRTFNLGDSRIFRARFERYLGTDPTEEFEEYQAIIDEIMSRLSVGNTSDDDVLFEAWELLFRAAEFEADGGNSLVIANQVYNAWRIREERRGAARNQAELDRQRRFQEEVVANRARTLQRARERQAALERTSTREPSEAGASNRSLPEDMVTEESFRARDLAETVERIASIEVQQAQSGIQAMLTFQSQIVSFFLQRRFQHAQMSSGFYRMIFRGSSQQLEVGRSELASFFPNTDLTFTVDTIEFVSREAVNDVRSGMRSVRSAYDGGDRMLALERLQETLVLGEHVPEVYQFPTEQRRTLLRIYRNLREARELANVRDYNSVEALVQETRELAPDFPATRILGSIDTARSMSDFAVFAAAQYRNRGQIEQARDELQRAIEIWPSNPSIRKFQTETSSMTDRGSQAVIAFDELRERGSDRDIYNRRMEFGVALSEDEERRPLLEDIINRVGQIEMLLGQSQEMVAQNNAFAAWDMLEQARELSPDDNRLNRARSELAPRVANYALVLDAARRSEEAGRHAAALAQLLQAREIYPGSRIARLGVERVGRAVMNDLR